MIEVTNAQMAYSIVTSQSLRTFHSVINLTQWAKHNHNHNESL